MKLSKFAVTLIAVAIVFAFAYGVATVKYRIFPFKQLSAAMKLVTTAPELGHSDYYFDKKEFFDHHGGEKYDVVFIGDSITDNAEWEDLFPSLKIANRGIGGDRTDGILKRLDSIYSTNAAKAFIMVGVNDFSLRLSVDTVFQNYQKITNELRSHGMAVYVQSTILSGRENKELNLKIKKLNTRLETMAIQTAGITYIDLNKALAPESFLEPKFSRDGVHLNGKGYEVWKNTITEHLRSQADTNPQSTH